MSLENNVWRFRPFGILFAATAYTASAFFSQRVLLSPEGTPLIWLPYIVSILVATRLGMSVWPGVLLGGIASTWYFDRHFDVAVLDGLTDTAAIALTVLLLHRINRQPLFSAMHSYYLSLAAIAGISFIFDGLLSYDLPDWLGIAVPQRDATWLNSLSTALLIMPVMLLTDTPHSWLPRQRWPEALLLALATALAGGIVLCGGNDWQHAVYYHPFLLFPLILWGALRFGRHAIALQALLLFAQSLWGFHNRYGYFANIAGQAGLNTLWLFHIVLNTTGMTLAIAIKQRTRLKNQLRVAAQAFTHNREGIMITDAQNRILTVNPAFTRITGYSQDEAKGRDPKFLSSGANDAEFYRGMWEKLSECGQWEGEIWDRRKNGQIFPKWLSVSVVRNPENDIQNYIGQFSDISDRKTQEEKMAHLAHFDPLTDLPNRSLFIDRLNQAIAPAKRESRNLAVLFIDLDNFKPINDTYGHDVGDLLLKEAAKRMQECVHRESDTIARIGGDEFVALLPSAKQREEAEWVAQRLLETLSEPFRLAGQTLQISCSIGIACYPGDGKNTETLMHNADIAMYRAKKGGRNGYRHYEDCAQPSDYSI